MIDLTDLIPEDEFSDDEPKGEYIPDYEPPKSLGEIILANNAHLKVILDNQAEIYSMMYELLSDRVVANAIDVHPDSTTEQKRYIKSKEDARNLFTHTKALQDRLHVHKQYLEVLVDKMKNS